MEKDVIYLYDGITDEYSIQELTDAEQAEHNEKHAKHELEQQKKAAELLLQEAEKAALLAKLGITAEEARLLIGGN
jgi:hypothetical protein